jgi:hypothetical protein
MSQDNEMNLNLNESDEDIRNDQVKLFLEEYKLPQYYQTLMNEGFDRLLSVSFFSPLFICLTLIYINPPDIKFSYLI